MEMKKGKEEQFIKEELEREAEEIRRENEAEGGAQGLPGAALRRIRDNLQEDIEDYEWSRRYPNLSEEERRALKLGQEVLEREALEKAHSRKKRSGKRTFKFYIALAAMLTMVFAVSMTSFGGPERIVQLVKSVVGEREVTKVNSGEDNLIIEEGDAEEAYQIISEELGIEPVRIMTGNMAGLNFEVMEYDRSSQTAELTYDYYGEKIIYFINVAYGNSSWGVDMEDKITGKFQMESDNGPIEVKEYELAESKAKRYSAEFTYQNVGYYLIGTMKKEEMESIINNFYFFP